MFLYVVADAILENLGQISTIILAFYMLVFIVIGLAVSVGLMVGFTWVRQKSELVKALRPVINSVDETTQAPIHKALPSPGLVESKLLRTATGVPAHVHTDEEHKKVNIAF